MLAKHMAKQGLLLNNVGGISGAMSYHGGAHPKAPTMNDLPVPAGDWQEAHSRRTAKYNTMLAIGVLLLAGALGFANTSGLIELNASPPKRIN